MTDPGMPDLLADRPADVSVSPPTVLAEAFHDLERFSVTLRNPDGETLSSLRDVLRVGKVTAVLPVDLARGELVLIRQFRVAAHLATRNGELVEIVAGHVEAGETPAEAAMRECVEEIGVRPKALYRMFEFLPAPGSIDEYATLFLGTVDAAGVPERAGAADEKEATRPVRVPIETAIAALERGTMHNGFLILALQWLALHRDRLDAILAGVPAAR
ncbi:MAG TPA: NUDIX hydrolase [Xanthobacteraceae bacterium]|jgi:ADP-ribose pyrophosphatase|nr:NUDIX hydrolase [Xanthobacteraceae bacterium]